jgi:glucose/arabinose dehydrogenase
MVLIRVVIASSFLLAVACHARDAAPSTAVARSGVPKATVLNSALEVPWGLAFLPDGRMLITQRNGTMVILSANGKTLQGSVSGVPAVAAVGQGGLLDVAVDPNFAADPWVYWAYSERGHGAEAGKAGTAVARGRLRGNALHDVSVIFRQAPKVSGNSHWGARLVFRNDATLLVTLGDRKQDDPQYSATPNTPSLATRVRKTVREFIPDARDVQAVTGHLGKIVRINRDGSVPAGNPDFGVAGALPEIWSYGHRNPQGAAIHPATGELWITEHGPQGGDELNRVLPGKNYGWPIRSYGCPYGAPVNEACRVGGGKHAPDYVEPVAYWAPISIAPSGLTFYTGDKFPEWRGNLFLGALAGTALWRVVLDGNVEVSRERLFAELGERIRCVKQGPDGWLYVLTGSGKLMRIER